MILKIQNFQTFKGKPIGIESSLAKEAGIKPLVEYSGPILQLELDRKLILPPDIYPGPLLPHYEARLKGLSKIIKAICK